MDPKMKKKIKKKKMASMNKKSVMKEKDMAPMMSGKKMHVM